MMWQLINMYSVFYGKQKTKKTELTLKHLEEDTSTYQIFDQKRLEESVSLKPFYQQINDRQQKKKWRK